MLYKWEENNRGLDHKCGVCKTVLSNHRAKNTCFGVHEEVCIRYHKTLFYTGTAHKCDACRKSVEVHDKRHREIAELLPKVLESNEDAVAARQPRLLSNKKRKSRKSMGMGLTEINFETGGKVEFDEWAATSTASKYEINVDELSLVDKINETNVTKAQKQERKRTKHHKRPLVITDEDVSKISDILHPSKNPLFDRTTGHDLLNNSSIRANVSYDANTIKYSYLRQAECSKIFANAKASAEGSPASGQITAILIRLGVDADFIAKHDGNRKSTYHQLRNAIEHDLICVENEERQIMKRMAGYWRFANKRTYNHMVRKNELWDWETGEKLSEIDEEDDTANDETHNTFSQQSTDTESVRRNEHSFLIKPKKPLDNEKAAANLNHTPSKRHDPHHPSTANSPHIKSPWQGIRDNRHLASSPSFTLTPIFSTTNHDNTKPSPTPHNISPTPMTNASSPPYTDYNNRFFILADLQDSHTHRIPIPHRASFLPRERVRKQGAPTLQHPTVLGGRLAMYQDGKDGGLRKREKKGEGGWSPEPWR